MSKRIFVGIPVSEELQQNIDFWQRQHSSFPVRWISGDNLHVTLIPPWEEDNVEKIIALLKTLEGTIGSAQISYSHVSYGPTMKEPRLIWAIGEPPPQLVGLRFALQKLLRRKHEFSRWLMHVTLARFRPNGFPSFPRDALDDLIRWSDTVHCFVLYESRLSPHGSEYIKLAEIDL